LKKLVLFCLLIGISLLTNGQIGTYRYLIQFKDKSNSSFSIQNPAAFVSQKSIDRRKKNNIPFIEQDLPVNNSYVKEISALGVKIIYPLKWINSVLIQTSPDKIKTILANKNVKGMYFPYALDSLSAKSGNKTISPKNPVSNSTLADISYGNSLTQNKQLGTDKMHANGITGKNTLITLLDDGFLNSNVVSYFQQVRDQKRIIATLCTSPNRTSVYNEGSHGTNVMSTIAAYVPDKLIGTAFNANFALAQTEEGSSEFPVEEVNWLRGAEWADSLGTDIISSSLGYSTFDNPFYNHTYNDLNGKTVLSTLAANWASEKGIICVISAGNEGGKTWNYISSPADALDILAVGAVDNKGLKASFSSFGPSYDQRIKPDVSAMGQATVIGSISSTIGTSNGTSFSAPLIAGLAAGLIEKFPKKTAKQIMNGIRKSGTLSLSPDNNLGYGIPNYERALAIIDPVMAVEPASFEGITVFPNPISVGQKLSLQRNNTEFIQVQVFNGQGQEILQFDWSSDNKEIYFGPMQTGKYYFRFTSELFQKVIPIYFTN
jgi:serine protease AprX